MVPLLVEVINLNLDQKPSRVLSLFICYIKIKLNAQRSWFTHVQFLKTIRCAANIPYLIR